MPPTLSDEINNTKIADNTADTTNIDGETVTHRKPNLTHDHKSTLHNQETPPRRSSFPLLGLKTSRALAAESNAAKHASCYHPIKSVSTDCNNSTNPTRLCAVCLLIIGRRMSCPQPEPTATNSM